MIYSRLTKLNCTKSAIVFGVQFDVKILSLSLKTFLFSLSFIFFYYCHSLRKCFSNLTEVKNFQQKKKKNCQEQETILFTSYWFKHLHNFEVSKRNKEGYNSQQNNVVKLNGELFLTLKKSSFCFPLKYLTRT